LKALIKETKELIEKEFKSHTRPNYEFRSRYKHTLRVLKWAERIQKIEGGDIDAITMAVLLHDIGWDEERPHNELSYEYALEYLNDKDLDDSVNEKICKAVLLHNQRQLPDDELSLEEKIVMDADIIDEIGIVSIIWDALSTATQLEDYDYYVVLDRVKAFHAKGFAARENELKTETGLAFYKERVAVYENAIANLEYELCLTEENPEELMKK
jgi:uncharacterized protein